MMVIYFDGYNLTKIFNKYIYPDRRNVDGTGFFQGGSVTFADNCHIINVLKLNL